MHVRAPALPGLLITPLGLVCIIVMKTHTRAYAMKGSYRQEYNRANRRNLLEARLHHLPQDSHEIRILERCCNTFLICQLLVHLVRLTMCALLYLNLNPVAWR
jgi:hypothetical protein